jgi:ABC-type glutathione transport system ATPase component
LRRSGPQTARALDVSVQAEIVTLLRDLQARHKLAYLFISHDLAVVKALADELVVMKDGTVMEAGPAAQIFTAPRTDLTDPGQEPKHQGELRARAVVWTGISAALQALASIGAAID